MLHLLKNNEVIRQVRSGSRLDMPGFSVSPAAESWPGYDGYTLVTAPLVPQPEPTPQELREQMPTLTPRQFRDALIDADIMPDHVTAAIGLIPNEKQRAKALNAWEYPTEFTRTDPLIDQIGAMFSLTSGQIDAMWQQALEA